MTDKEYLMYIQGAAVKLLGACGLNKPKWSASLKRLNGAVPKGGGRFFLEGELRHDNNGLPWVTINSEAAREPLTIATMLGNSHRPEFFDAKAPVLLSDLMEAIKINFRYIGGYEERHVPPYLSMAEAELKIRDFLSFLLITKTEGFVIESFATRIARSKLQLIINVKAERGHYQLVSFEFDVSQ